MNLKKVTQLVNYLLSKYTGTRLNYTKLIKLLYIADKEALKRWDVAITEDRYASLRNGPIVSDIYNLIMDRRYNEPLQLEWNANFSREKYDLVAVGPNQSNADELSEREEKLLDEIDAEFHDWTFRQLIEYTHRKDLFPEWEDPGDSSSPIPLKKILRSIGRTDEEIAQILSDEAVFQREQQLPQPACL